MKNMRQTLMYLLITSLIFIIIILYLKIILNFQQPRKTIWWRLNFQRMFPVSITNFIVKENKIPVFLTQALKNVSYHMFCRCFSFHVVRLHLSFYKAKKSCNVLLPYTKTKRRWNFKSFDFWITELLRSLSFFLSIPTDYNRRLSKQKSKDMNV